MNDLDLQRSAVQALVRVMDGIVQYSYGSDQTLKSGLLALEVLQWLEQRNA